jgi:uncharacterized protein (DUF2147 family)
MRRRHAFAGAFAAAAVFAGQASADGGVVNPPLADGVWRNPENSVHVEIQTCGEAVCGYVVWASPRAEADARRGGTDVLVGLRLFRDFVRQKTGEWRGTIFVPDLNATLAGSAVALDGERLKARACLIGKLFCKSQIWTRVG